MSDLRAQRVVAILEKSDMPQPTRPIRASAELVWFCLRDYLRPRASEYLIACYLNVQNILVGISEFTEGSNASVTVHPQGIFRDALLKGASAIITAHQHPSGVAEPSKADEDMWKRMKSAGELLGIPVIDNIILGEKRFFSEGDDESMSYADLERLMVKRYGTST